MKNYFKSFLIISFCLFTIACQKNVSSFDSQLQQGNDKIYRISKTELQTMYDKYMQTGVLPKKISNNKVLTKSENESNYLTQQALDELVSDDFINSITNDYNEVVIDGILYNITPYGTFYIEEYSRLILNALVDEITLANPVESLDLDNVQIDLSMYDTYYDEETEVEMV